MDLSRFFTKEVFPVQVGVSAPLIFRSKTVRIVVHDKLKVFIRNTDEEDILAFVCPENNKSMQETAQHWAGDKAKILVIDNIPTTGFKIAKSVRRYSWSGRTNVVWRMEDSARGFEFEITSENMAKIISSTTLEKGEITVPCVYGRANSRLALIPQGTEWFKNILTPEDLKKEAKEKAKACKESLKKAKPGDYLIDDHHKKTYLGRLKIHLSNQEPQVYHGWLTELIKSEFSNYQYFSIDLLKSYNNISELTEGTIENCTPFGSFDYFLNKTPFHKHYYQSKDFDRHYDRSGNIIPNPNLGKDFIYLDRNKLYAGTPEYEKLKNEFVCREDLPSKGNTNYYISDYNYKIKCHNISKIEPLDFEPKA